jgi:ubiquinone/menaquinone biosynthesis C-methylase UbiE
MDEPKIQVKNPKEHYSSKDSLERFISYFYQIDLVKKLKPESILEIGIGNKTVSNYLKQNGLKADTCDFDKTLEPDYVADIRNLPFADNSYDMILAFEILEHLPWEDVDKALNELHRVSKKYVLVSIPYSSINFELTLKIPLLARIIKRPFLNIFWRIPYFFKTIKFSGEHYWEMGKKNYPAKKIRKAFSKYFKIKKEVRPVLNPYHYFFVLEKK